MLNNLVIPAGDFFERFHVTQVERQYHAIDILEEGRNEGLVSFLPCRVPDPELALLATLTSIAGLDKVDADSRYLLLVEPFFRVLKHQT